MSSLCISLPKKVERERERERGGGGGGEQEKVSEGGRRKGSELCQCAIKIKNL